MPIPLQPPPGATLPEAIARLRAAAEAAREALYRDEVFPHAARRLWDGRADLPAAEVLLVPVGTQPFAPLLAALGVPSRRVALLHTDQTRPQALEVERALQAGLGDEAPEVSAFSLGDEDSGASVVRAADAALFWAGDPWPVDVTVDLTGGRKRTSAVLGAIAALRGFRQVYVEGRPLVGPFVHEERLVAVADAAALLAEDHRVAGTVLLEAGAFAAAAERLAQAANGLIAGPALPWLAALAEACAEPEREARAEAWRALGERLPPSRARELLAAADRSAAPDRVAREVIDALRLEGAWR